MLYTRCPACTTTFRITADALGEAGGQVRCGRCATVFNVHEADSGGTAASVETGQPGDHEALDEARAAKAGSDIGQDSDAAASELRWPPEPEVPRRRLWPYAAVLAALALAAQGIHHFRGELAAHEAIGPALARAYELIDLPLTPNWDLSQCEVTDSSARTGPNSAPQGSLVIAARIYNGGPRAQPWPHVYLRLNDRWDSLVGSRTFAPSEYLATELAAAALMAAGEAARLELTVVDPGSDTYGFELDLCIEREPGQLSCQADAIFR